MHSFALSLVVAVAAQQPAPPAVTVDAGDERALSALSLGSDGPALIDFFKKRTPPGPGREALDAAAVRLTDKDETARKRAAAELVRGGPAAVPVLRQLVNNPDDPDTAARARLCLKGIEGADGANLTAAAVRALAVRRPEGAAAALLDYLPYAEDDHVADEIQAALIPLALRNGKPDPALLAALTDRASDKAPMRRSAAAVALVRAGGPAEPVLPLLKDPRPVVRLRVALALAAAHDNRAVPVLLDLVGELPSSHRKDAEEFLTQLAGQWAFTVPQGDDAVARRLRRDLWAAWWNAADGTTLLETFKDRTPTDAERQHVLDLIAKLDDASAEVRGKAEADILTIGPKAAPLLRQAMQGDNARIAALAKRCLEPLPADRAGPLPDAAIRLLALRRPEGTVAALIAYLPFADTAETVREVRGVLADIGCPDGKPDPALLGALRDPLAVRRAAAAFAVCRSRNEDGLAAVKPLLKDADAEVRLRAALGLAARGDRDAVPVLLALLSDAPLELAQEAEEFLARSAGPGAPTANLSGPALADERRKVRDAWADWWKNNGDTVDLTSLPATPHQYGYILAVESYDPTRRTGRVLEVDAAGKVRWEVTGLQYPIDAELLPNDRILICEQNLNKVSEHNLKGKIIWEKQVPQAFTAQGLRNGNTFIAGRQMLIEVDRNGKEIMNVTRFNETILAARKMRDGQILFVTYQGTYVKLDAAGKEIKTGRVPFDINFGASGAEPLPNDHVIVSVQALNKVVEYDQDGKVVWEAQVSQPGIPTRLPNGHTLVPSPAQNRVVELDRTGKVVAEHKDLPFKAMRMLRGADEWASGGVYPRRANRRDKPGGSPNPEPGNTIRYTTRTQSPLELAP